ncbi:MAG: hypothetical protein HXY24_17330 [Rubrivivax sp.]|nr:hypothetical protein [Rubrivivax sp.]
MNGIVVGAVQWPYRFASIVVLSGLLTTMFALELCRQGRLPTFARIGVWVIFGLSIVLFLALFAQVISNGRTFRASEEVLQGPFGQPEYYTTERGPSWRDYVDKGGLTAQCEAVEATCVAMEHTAHIRRWQINARRDMQLVLPIFAFPAWSVKINDFIVHPDVDRATGLLKISVPSGSRNDVVVQWSRLPQERLGFFVSVAGILTLTTPRRQNTCRPDRTWSLLSSGFK